MKKIAFIISVLVGGSLSAQNYTDALRYSAEELNGTARFKGMSGAFGALGGDFSAIGINPASSSVFSYSLIGITGGVSNVKNNTTYNGANSNNKDSNFNIGQFGLVFPIASTSKDAQWKKFSLGLNYERTKNFEANDLAFGGNSDKNLGDYFKFFADGIKQQNLLLEDYENKRVVGRSSLQDIYDRMGRAPAPFRYRNALLGHYTGLIRPSSGVDEIKPGDSDEQADKALLNKEYYNNTGNTAEQQFERTSTGGIYRFNINLSTQYSNFLYLGMNLNTYSVDYKEKLSHWEIYDGSTNIKNAYFENNRNTTGNGFSLQLGAIVKATESLRLGVTYSSPTWYTLQEEYTQYLSANKRQYYADPKVIVTMPEYKFRTPGSWTLSAAYLFGKSAVVSVDYMYKDYRNIYFRSNLMKAQNSLIENELGSTSTLRLGAEYRIPFQSGEKAKDFFSLRAGYRYEQSPYANAAATESTALTGYSLGAGVTLGGVRLDISYDAAKQTLPYQMYENVLTNKAAVASNYGNFLFTFTTQLF